VVAQVRVAIPTEHDEQVTLFREMHLRGCTDPRWRQAFAIPNGGLRSKKTAARLKAEGVKAGVPDIFLPVSVGIWSGLFIEMKRTKGGRLTDEQREFIDKLDPHFIVAVCHGAQDAIEKIHDYLTKGWITA
jgi:hypothetical protein